MLRTQLSISRRSITREAPFKRVITLSAVVTALALVAGACGSGNGSGSGGDKTISVVGTGLLAGAAAGGAVADAVTYSVESSSGAGSTAQETFARRGDDSIVAAGYDSGGRLEVRRVGGESYVLSSLDLPAGTPEWLHIANDADRPLVLSLLGSDYVAPTPQEASKILAGGVASVNALRAKAGQRVLTVTARNVGERPSEIQINRSEALFVGRVASLWSGKTKVGVRTYQRVLWGASVPMISAPSVASEFNGFFDTQVLQLAEPLRRRPVTLPANWEIRAVVGLSTGQGNGICQEVLTLFAPLAPLVPVKISDGYLAVYLEPTGCSTPRAAGSAEFSAGEHAGWIGTAPDGSRIGSLSVFGTSIRFRTNLDASTLSKALATWRPLTK